MWVVASAVEALVPASLAGLGVTGRLPRLMLIILVAGILLLLALSLLATTAGWSLVLSTDPVDLLLVRAQLVQLVLDSFFGPAKLDQLIEGHFGIGE